MNLISQASQQRPHDFPRFLRGNDRFPDDLRDYCDRYTAQAIEIARAALAATASFSERVD